MKMRLAAGPLNRSERGLLPIVFSIPHSEMILIRAASVSGRSSRLGPADRSLTVAALI